MRTYQELLAQARGDPGEIRQTMSKATEEELLQEEAYFHSREYHVKASDIHFQASVYAREETSWESASLFTDWYLRFWCLAYLNYFRSEYRVTGLLCVMLMALTAGAGSGFWLNAVSTYGHESVIADCAKGFAAVCGSGICAGMASYFYERYSRLGRVTERHHPIILTTLALLSEDDRLSFEAMYRVMRW